jgi:L-threonylcarbamoyladenylate synthase
MKSELISFVTKTGTNTKACAEWLMQGEVAAIPTETVYGLAANALNESAVLKVFSAKNRPQFNPLIIHVADFNEAKNWVRDIPAQAEALAEAFWPGPLTMLLPKSDLIPDLVTSGSKYVAVRVPAHSMTLELLKGLDFPIAAPSANPSGYVSPTSAEHVYHQLNGKIPYILDGGLCQVGLESTIVGWDTEKNLIIHRPGGLPIEAIKEVAATDVISHAIQNENPSAPGQLKSHYATQTPLYLMGKNDLINQNNEYYLIRFQAYHTAYPEQRQKILSSTGSLDEAARNLFRILREIDVLNADVVYAEKVPDTGLGIAINDRLFRAQHLLK